MKKCKVLYTNLIAILFIVIFSYQLFASNIIYHKEESIGPGSIETKIREQIPATISEALSEIKIYEHDGMIFVKGEDKGRFSLSGYCACKKCGSGTGVTYSGKHVRENHTIAADRKVLPIGTYIILENAVGKDGTIYDGVYQVEDIGGGVKNNHIDIYRPTHDLAALVTYFGRAYGEVYIAIPINLEGLNG